jgi:hypothetical protein
MKVQLRDLAKYSTQWERRLLHFLTSLTHENNYAHRRVSFLHKLETRKTMPRKETGFNYQSFVSFFNELSIEKEKLCS